MLSSDSTTATNTIIIKTLFLKEYLPEFIYQKNVNQGLFRIYKLKCKTLKPFKTNKMNTI